VIFIAGLFIDWWSNMGGDRGNFTAISVWKIYAAARLPLQTFDFSKEVDQIPRFNSV